MTEFVTDTHSIIWFLSKNKRLSGNARTIFLKAQSGYSTIIVPSIVIAETLFLIQRNRVEKMVLDVLLELPEYPHEGIYIYPLNKGVIETMSDFGPAAIPELTDRIIAATARYLNIPLLTVDHVIDNSELVETVW